MSSVVDWSEGYDWYGGWIGFQALLFPTFIANVFTFLLISTSPVLCKNSNGKIIRLLTLQDALWSLLCLIQCTLNLSDMSIYQTYRGCWLQTFYGIFFIISTSCTLCLIAYNSERKIHMQLAMETDRRILCCQLIFWLFAAIVALTCTQLLGPEPSLVPSGIFCFFNLLSVRVGIFFYVTVALLLGFLSICYLRIYLLICQQATYSPFSANLRLQTRARNLKVARRMSAFVLAFLLCASPTVVVCLYEQIRQQYLSASIHLVAGFLAHLSSLLNPLLYVWLNPAARQACFVLLCCLPAARNRHSLTVEQVQSTTDQPATIQINAPPAVLMTNVITVQPAVNRQPSIDL